MPGKTITIQKIFDPVTGKLTLKSSDGSIKTAVDLVRTEEADRTAFRAKHGRMNKSLVAKLATLNDNDKVKVIVTLKPPVGITYLNKFDYPTDQLKANSLDAKNAKPIRNFAEVYASHSLEGGVGLTDFESVIEIKKHDLVRLIQDADITSIEEFTPGKTVVSPLSMIAPSLFAQTYSDNYNTLSRSAYWHAQSPVPVLGAGIHAATFESGLSPTFVSCAQLSPASYDRQPVPFANVNGGTPDPGYAKHSHATFDMLALAAPGASLYHRRSWSYWQADDQDYIINNAINSVSMSTSFGDINDMMRMDDFAYRYPYPTFYTPTGNDGSQIVPGWANSYNQIIVGNVQDSNWTRFGIPINSCSNGLTQTKNPPPVTGGCIDGGTYPNCAGDREMPTIVAPGWSPHGGVGLNAQGVCVGTGYTLFDGCADLGFLAGTSSAAPTANGMGALLMAQTGFLVYQPEGVRAIMIATARNVTGGEWNSWIDGTDGGGVIHGYNAINLGKTATRVNPGNTAALSGYWYGSFSSNDFANYATKTFNIKTPSPLPGGAHLRIVLTWDSSPDFLAGVNDLSDLDLTFGAFASSSYDGNIEVIDVPNSSVSANTSYPVVVRPFAWRHHPNARSASIYGALTWAYVADHAH